MLCIDPRQRAEGAFDALKGVVIEDDNWVRRIEAERAEPDGGSPPRRAHLADSDRIAAGVADLKMPRGDREPNRLFQVSRSWAAGVPSQMIADSVGVAKSTPSDGSRGQSRSTATASA